MFFIFWYLNICFFIIIMAFVWQILLFIIEIATELIKSFIELGATLFQQIRNHLDSKKSR